MENHPEFKGGSQLDAGYDILPQDTSNQDSGATDTGHIEKKKIIARYISKPPTIDGDISDFYLNEPVILTTKDYVRLTSDSNGDNDISGRFYFMWDENNLYIAVIVKDDTNYNTESAENIWKGDSVQMAFDADFDKTEMSYDSDGDYEIGFALVNKSVLSYRWVAPISASSMKMTTAYKRNSDEIWYEISLPFNNLSPFKGTIGNRAGISFLINDNDGNGREGFVQFTEGIGLGKNPSAFAEIELAGGVCEIDKNCNTKSDCLNSEPICNCVGEWICNGRNKCELICAGIDGGTDIISDSSVDVYDAYLPDEGLSDITKDVITTDSSIEDTPLLYDTLDKDNKSYS
jgi:hypothetical protein